MVLTRKSCINICHLKYKPLHYNISTSDQSQNVISFTCYEDKQRYFVLTFHSFELYADKHEASHLSPHVPGQGEKQVLSLFKWCLNCHLW